MRNLGLDILRLGAVLLVLFRHVEFIERDSFWLDFLHTGGWVGVDLFFVISGFLISSLLFQEFSQTKNISIKRFLIRRGFKIYPPFWVLIGFSLIVFSLSNKLQSFSQILAELLFVQNYWPGIWLYTWSLAVEEHFYLSISGLFWLFKRLDLSLMIKFVPVICCLVCILCFGLRYVEIWEKTPYLFLAYAFKTHLRIDSLCFGVMISYFVFFKNIIGSWSCWLSALSLFLGSLLLLPAFIYPIEVHRWVLIWGIVIFYVGSGFMVLGCLKLKSSKRKTLQVFGGLGSASYSIYLWHMPVATFLLPKVIPHMTKSSLITFYLVVSGGLGWIMHCLIEKPALKFRDRIYSGTHRHKSGPQKLAYPLIESPGENWGKSLPH